MLVETSKSALRLLCACAALLCGLAISRGARAEESVIRHPGDHPNYAVELEPHLAFAFFLPQAGSTGVGIGGRATIPIVKNGFVPSINNSVGIGFGLDWLHYDGCYYQRYPYAYNAACDNLNSFWVPVVMQWNFFLGTHWSVFGEPGISIVYHNFGNYYGCYNGLVQVSCGSGPNHVTVEPVIFFGGRYHFSETAALTLRIGWPYASIGVSFMP
jgi:hypothetical protein